MKILLTSGGTKVPIDNVRYIGNISKGGFGQRLASCALIRGHKVDHIVAEDAPTPFEFKVDLCAGRHVDYESMLQDLHSFSRKYMSKYKCLRYNTYDEYLKLVHERMTNFDYDAAIMCAAVSDYGVKKHDGKLKSEDGKVNLVLFKLAKVIKDVKCIKPETLLVGFKLLVNEDRQSLVCAAEDMIVDSNCDFVVANDLRDLKSDLKTITVVSDYEDFDFTGNSESAALEVIETTEKYFEGF